MIHEKYFLVDTLVMEFITTTLVIINQYNETNFVISNYCLILGGSTYSGNILKINSVRKEDRVTYYCVADNGVSKGDRRNINLEVEFSPVITVPRPRLGQALQYDMDLECHIEAYPPPAIIWVKDEIILSNNQHYSISHFATADEFTDSTLRVITIEKRQYGDYRCKAINKLGSDEAKVNLFETVIPVCPPACGQAHYGGTGVITASTIVFLFVEIHLILSPNSFKNLSYFCRILSFLFLRTYFS